MPLILGANSVSGYTVKNSLRFNSGSSDNLSRTTGSTGNRKTVTFSGWFKRSSLSGNQMIFSWGGGGLDVVNFFFNGSPETLNFYNYPGSLGANFTTNQLFRDVSAWYHIVAVWNSNNAKPILFSNLTKHKFNKRTTSLLLGQRQDGQTNE